MGAGSRVTMRLWLKNNWKAMVGPQLLGSTGSSCSSSLGRLGPTCWAKQGQPSPRPPAEPGFWEGLGAEHSLQRAWNFACISSMKAETEKFN